MFQDTSYHKRPPSNESKSFAHDADKKTKQNKKHKTDEKILSVLSQIGKFNDGFLTEMVIPAAVDLTTEQSSFRTRVYGCRKAPRALI